MHELILTMTLMAFLAGCQAGSKPEAPPQEPSAPEVDPRPLPPIDPTGMTPNPPDWANPQNPSPPPVDTKPAEIPPTPTEISDNPLYPGQNLLALRPTQGGLEVLLAHWLACDGVFEMKSRRAGKAITVDVVDNNSSTERVSCSRDTRVSTRIDELPPGTYEVTLNPGTGHRPLWGRATVTAAAGRRPPPTTGGAP